MEIRDAYDLLYRRVIRIQHPDAWYALEDGTPITKEYLAGFGLDRVRFTGWSSGSWIADLVWPATRTIPGPNPALAERLIGQKILNRDLRGRMTTVMHLANGETFDYLRRQEQGIDVVVDEWNQITKVTTGPWKYTLTWGSVYRENRETGTRVCLWIDDEDLAKNAWRYDARAETRIRGEFRELFRAIEARKLREMMRLWIEQGCEVYEDDKGRMYPDVEVTFPAGEVAVVDLFDIACMTCDHCDEVCLSWGSRIDPPEYEDVCLHPALPGGEAYEVLGTCRGRYWSDDPAVQAAYTQQSWLETREEAAVYELPCRLVALDDKMDEQHGENWRDDPALLAAYQADAAAIAAEYETDPDTDGPHPGAHRLLDKMKEESP